MKPKPRNTPPSDSIARGNLFIFSAPSGAGKTTLVQTLTKSMRGITVSISHTTRSKRPAEQEGINYHFISKPVFEEMVRQEKFLEYANIFGHFYGTSRQWVEETLAQGLDVILEIDWQGCQHIQRLFQDCISVFIVPPSPEILAARLTGRGQEHPDVLAERLADACETFKHLNEYDYIVLNEDLEQAICDLKSIITTHRLKCQRQQQALKPLLMRFMTDS